MFLTRRKFHFEAYNKFCFIALAIFIRLFLSLSLSLCFRFTRCLFFSRYATARRRILSFILSPFFFPLLSLFHSSRDASLCMCVYYIYINVYDHACARARACVYLCAYMRCSRSVSLAAAFEAQFTSRGTLWERCIVVIGPVHMKSRTPRVLTSTVDGDDNRFSLV